MENLKMKINIQKDIRWAFFYFLVVVILGVFLRSAVVFSYPFDFNYRYVLHSHSHTAILGWIYVLLVAFISREFLPKTAEKTYRKWFYATQFSVLGMLFSFIGQGYGAISITFATIFVFLSYFYAYFFIKETKNQPKEQKISYFFVKMGIFYLVLSSLGIWAIPVAVVKFGKDSDFYQSAIAFFLHFQYNGWILSSLTGLIIRNLQWDLRFLSLMKKLFYGFQISVVGTLVISLLGIFSSVFLYFLGGIFAFLWLIIGLKFCELYLKKEAEKSLWAWCFFGFFLLKILAMIFGIFLGMKSIIFNNPDLIISYLHLNFLGIINSGLFFLLIKDNFLKNNSLYSLIYLIAFFFSEILITYKGVAILLNFTIFEFYFVSLLAVSALFLIPALGWFFRKKDC